MKSGMFVLALVLALLLALTACQGGVVSPEDVSSSPHSTAASVASRLDSTDSSGVTTDATDAIVTTGSDETVSVPSADTTASRRNTTATTTTAAPVSQPLVQMETTLPVTTTRPTTTTTAKPVQVDPDTVETARPTTAPTQEPPLVKALEPISPADYYGLNQLKARSNSDALVAAYYRLVAGVQNMDSTISLRDEHLPITVEELDLVYSCYRNDYPQHFWLGNSYQISYAVQGGKKIALELTPKALDKQPYLMTAAEKETAEGQWRAAAQTILSQLNSSMTEYQRELLIHDALINACSYDTTLSLPYSHSAYGALVVGSAVCEGYARAFQYLLYQAGIPCLVVEGTSYGGNHAWNMARIDGEWYYVDVTWDDPASETPRLYYSYFNLTEEWITEDHVIDTPYFQLPSATSLKANYHQVNQSIVSAFSVADAAARLKQSPVLRVFVTGDPQTYSQEFASHFSEVMRQAGRSGSASISTCGREVLVVLK